MNPEPGMLELKLFLLLLVANGAPILSRKLLGSRFNYPLDWGLKTPGGRRWLGSSKTFRGVIAAVVATALLAPLLGFTWGFGVVFGFLAMLGDLFTSFTKRRLGLPSSSRANVLDQVPESVFPLIYCIPSLDLAWQSLFTIVMAFWLAGVLLSRLLYRIGIRRQPY